MHLQRMFCPFKFYWLTQGKQTSLEQLFQGLHNEPRGRDCVSIENVRRLFFHSLRNDMLDIVFCRSWVLFIEFF